MTTMIKKDAIQEIITQDGGDKKLLNNIIDYWNTDGLSSFDSSTSRKDSYTASLDNYIESKLLSEILVDYCRRNQKNDMHVGLDIGAGLGRFSLVLARHLQHVYAIEPAPQLYAKLKIRCEDISAIEVYNTSFEAFFPSEKIDVIVVSGILYLYDDRMLSSFMDKLYSHLRPGGIVIIRDFIIPNEIRKFKSSYVKDGYCYYRDPNYWKGVADLHNMNLIEIFRSTPQYNPYISMAMNIIGLNRMYSIHYIKNRVYMKISKCRREKKNFTNNKISTVFIILCKKVPCSV